jgi:VIT1/CCC1 family predicted Fe2+/Mn2+ transporter
LLILGFANLVADGISMAVGDYLSSKSEKEYYDIEKRRETWEVKHNPKGEEDEMLEIYKKKGLNRKDSKSLVNILKKNKKLWVETMMHDELGLIRGEVSPIKNGLVTFLSFNLFGFIPLAVYLFGVMFGWDISDGFLLTSIFVGVAMFSLGATKVKITGKNWFRSGIETLMIGGIAACAAYFVGKFLAGIL